MEGAPVNVRFSCQATRCNCEIVVQARMIDRQGSRLYEYSIGNECPRCGHRIFGQHRPTGETPIADRE
jgi:DNA-directed RNA polymerase subunit RPC12/RpoP